MADGALNDPTMSDETMTDAAAGAMTDGEARSHLEGCLNEVVDPAATLAAMPDAELAWLADGLYRHLDTPSPAFGARFWYIQVTNELSRRRLRAARPAGAVSDDPAPSEVSAR